MLKRSFLLALLCMMAMSSSGADTELPNVPTNVAWLYVFLQNPMNTAKDSGREIATMVAPEDFRKNFASYRGVARRDKMKLIITAETIDHLWVQEQIQFKGKKLQRAPYYNPGIDRVVPGAEIPLN